MEPDGRKHPSVRELSTEQTVPHSFEPSREQVFPGIVDITREPLPPDIVHPESAAPDELVVPEIVKTSAQQASYNNEVSCLSSSGMTLTENSKMRESMHTNEYSPNFKDQVQTVLVSNDDDVESSEQRLSCVDDGALAPDIAERSRGHDSSQELPLEGQTVIPMAEAFVIAEADRAVSNSSEEYPIVQLEEGNISTISPYYSATGSIQTRTTNGLSSEGHDSSDRMVSSHNDDSGKVGSTIVDSKLKEMAREAVQSERQFWMRIIITAIVLNSLLVSGVVVAGFCFSGACSSKSQSESLSSPGGATFSPSNAPTPITYTSPPSRSTQEPDMDIAIDGSNPNTGGENPNFEFDTPDAGTVIEMVNSTMMPSFGQQPESALSNTTFNNTGPSIWDTSIVTSITLAPSDISTVAKDARKTILPDDDRQQLVTSAPLDETEKVDNDGNAEDSSSPQGSGTSADDNSGDNIPIWILIVGAVVIESLIVGSLVLYYRRWKRHVIHHTEMLKKEAVVKHSSSTKDETN